MGEAEVKVSALATLCDLRNGRTMAELSDQLAEVIEAVRRTGKAGQLTLRLMVKPMSKGKTDEEVQPLALEDSISTKLPQLERGVTLFFSDAGGGLERNDPRQMSLHDLKKVPEPESAAAQPLKIVDGGKGGA
jgi:hypothetical protein